LNGSAPKQAGEMPKRLGEIPHSSGAYPPLPWKASAIECGWKPYLRRGSQAKDN
jgi:hypothetical protein